MSGIAQIIQAMMGVSPVVTPMQRTGGGGGGRVGPAPMGMGGDFGAGRPRQQQQQMPQIGMEKNPEMMAPQHQPVGQPGQPSGPTQQGPPVPAGYQRPQGQSYTRPDPQAESEYEVIQRAFAQNEVAIQELQMDNSVRGQWAAREKLPGLLQQREALKAQAAQYNQNQAQVAQDQRYQRALQVLTDNKVPPEQADPLARQAAMDDARFQDIMQMAMGERETKNQLARDQGEEFRNETDIAYALPLIVPGVDEATAMQLAASGESLTNIVALLVGDEERAQKRIDDWNKSQAKIRDSMFEADQAILTTEKALEDVGLTTTGIGSYLQDFRGFPAKDLHEALETLRAMTGFKALYDMRQASPTGGALGNVSNMEVKLLYSAWTNLNQGQSPSRLRENLNELLDRYKRVRFLIEQEQEGNLRGVPAVEQKKMADEFINQTHIEQFRSSRPATADTALQLLKSGEISKRDFEDKFGFLPIEGTY